MSYALAPGLTENLLGSAFRFLLSRARRAPISEGTLVEATPPGISVDGGWLARKQLPPAGMISEGMAVLAIAAGAVLLASVVRRPRRSQPGSRRRT
jgi:hypothetical protein